MLGLFRAARPRAAGPGGLSDSGYSTAVGVVILIKLVNSGEAAMSSSQEARLLACLERMQAIAAFSHIVCSAVVDEFMFIAGTIEVSRK